MTFYKREFCPRVRDDAEVGPLGLGPGVVHEPLPVDLQP